MKKRASRWMKLSVMTGAAAVVCAVAVSSPAMADDGGFGFGGGDAGFSTGGDAGFGFGGGDTGGGFGFGGGDAGFGFGGGDTGGFTSTGVNDNGSTIDYNAIANSQGYGQPLNGGVDYGWGNAYGNGSGSDYSQGHGYTSYVDMGGGNNNYGAVGQTAWWADPGVVSDILQGNQWAGAPTLGGEANPWGSSSLDPGWWR